MPTGFVSAEFVQQKKRSAVGNRMCPRCHAEGLDHDANYCKFCGEPLVV